MPNYKLLIQYDGTHFAGWQTQKNAETVQQTIVDAIETILRQKVKLIGSGRTDSGVHALGQVANFVTHQKLDLYKFKHSLNALIGKDIAVSDIQKVDQSFHSRFSAVKRSYIYLINKKKSPFLYNYSYLNKNIAQLDVDKLNQLSKVLIGTHDFEALSKKNKDVNNSLCEVYDAHWRRSKDLLIFYIRANRFLRGMVRAIVGTTTELVQQRKSNVDMLEIIEKKDRAECGQLIPAHGLFLYKVEYK
jgi:tRNA pseudouridine38-40 synthase